MEANNETATETRLLTDRELCERLQISRKTAWELRKAKRLGFYQLGNSVRYAEHHVKAYLASVERAAKEREFRRRA